MTKELIEKVKFPIQGSEQQNLPTKIHVIGYLDDQRKFYLTAIILHALENQGNNYEGEKRDQMLEISVDSNAFNPRVFNMIAEYFAQSILDVGYYASGFYVITRSIQDKFQIRLYFNTHE